MLKSSCFAAALIFVSIPADAAQLKLLVGGSMQEPFREVGADFAKQTGHKLDVTVDTTGALQKRLRSGEKADIILVDGEFAGAVNRVPQADDLRSNMVRGGAAQATELTAREREICARLGPALRERGLLFVGLDVIDGFLTEINVTSPTGIRAVKNLGGPDIAVLIWDKIEAMRGK